MADVKNFAVNPESELVSYGYIYTITNTINGKQYVGQTTRNPKIRWQEHHYGMEQNDRKNAPLYAAFQKYGIENFSFEVVETVPVSELDEKEQDWIARLNTYSNGYNATCGGQHNKSYYSEEERKAICQSWLDNDKNATTTAKKMGCSRAVVREICQSYGFITDERPRFDHALLAQKVQELGSVRQVSKLFQCDRTVVYDACHEYNIPLKGKDMSVVMIDEKDNVIQSFPSVANAVRYLQDLGVIARISDICACCKGKQKTAFGYKWRYLADVPT